jgi:hypothetical protein
MPENNNHTNKNAVDALFWREEILQVLYWMEGEGLETSVPFNRLMVLLNTTSENLLFHLKNNTEAGFLEGPPTGSNNCACTVTPSGALKITCFGVTNSFCG